MHFMHPTSTKSISQAHFQEVSSNALSIPNMHTGQASLTRSQAENTSQESISFCLARKSIGNSFDIPYIVKGSLEKSTAPALFNVMIFPLYLPSETTDPFDHGQNSTSVPNLNPTILKRIELDLGMRLNSRPLDYGQATYGNVCMINSPEIRDEYRETFTPIDLLDYIYAVLYSPSYREKHKEFLKIDYQKVPFPRNTTTFWQLVRLGGQLRQLHLLESPKVEEYITGYSEDGSNEITTKIGKKDWELFDVQNQVGRVWINDTQFFDKIPLTTWELYMGGHQPAQKWLKDRRGRTLDIEDILNYQKIIVALAETHLLIQEIGTIRIE